MRTKVTDSSMLQKDCALLSLTFLTLPDREEVYLDNLSSVRLLVLEKLLLPFCPRSRTQNTTAKLKISFSVWQKVLQMRPPTLFSRQRTSHLIPGMEKHENVSSHQQRNVPMQPTNWSRHPRYSLPP